MGWLCGVGVFGLIECSHSLPALHSGLQFNNNNKIFESVIMKFKKYFCKSTDTVHKKLTSNNRHLLLTHLDGEKINTHIIII